MLRFPFNLEELKAKFFEELKVKYDEWQKSEPLTGPLNLTTGWHDITPQQAEELLRRNRPGANCKASLSTILSDYVGQMLHDQWKATGQPIIFDENGVLVDGQHRLWACLFSNTTIKSFVVTGVPAIPYLFAFIDNGKARNPAAALQTAGFNGVSPVIAHILKIKVDIETGSYTASMALSRPRMSPIDFVHLIGKYPNAKLAARLAASDYLDAVAMVGGNKPMVGYLAMETIHRYGPDVADDFFGEMTDFANDYEPDSAITGLRKLLVDDQKKERPMQRHQVLGNIIKAFNAWYTETPLKKRWAMLVNEDFPTFVAAAARPQVEDLDPAEAA